MKKATVLGLSANQKLILYLQQGKTFIQSKLQGFDISQDNRHRLVFDQLLNKQIEISFNKNQKTIRYQNQFFLINNLKIGALKLNQKEIDESKLFTQQNKAQFIQNSTVKLPQDTNFNIQDLNHKSNANILKKLIKNATQTDSKIEYLSEHILLRINFQQKNYLLKCYLNNYKHYFNLFPQVSFYKHKFLPSSVKVIVKSQRYNLLSRQTQIYVSLDDEFQQKLLKEGFISLNQKNIYENSIVKITNSLQNTVQAIKNNEGIYQAKSEILSFIYAKNNYVGIVTNVIEGYIFQITSSKTKKTEKVQLAMIVCPIGEDSGSYQCRQFARKNLIGKQVNVYLQKQEGLNRAGSIIRIQDWKDVETLMLQNGYANVRQQLRNNVLGQKYVLIQTKMRQKKKGIHRKQLGNKRYQDLSQSPLNKSHLKTFLPRRLQILNQLSMNENAVIQQIINVMTYKVRIQSSQVLLNIKLEGILMPFLNPNLKEYIEIQQQTEKYLKLNFYQRNVIASITDFDQENNQYIGVLTLQKTKQQLQQLLIKNSLVYADKYNFISKYNKNQSTVRKQGKLIWQNKLKAFQPGCQLDKQKYCFEGKFSWLKGGKIAFVQPRDNFQTLQKLQNKLRSANLNKLQKEKVLINAWCAAPYEGDLYRGVIKSRKDNNVTIQFIDWGNQEIVKIEQLKQLPQQFLYVEKQCIEVKLNLVAKTRNRQAIQKVRQLLFEGGIYVFKKVYGNLVDFYDSQTSSMNEQLIMKGFLKADKQQIKLCQNKQVVKVVQQQLRKQRIGIWEQSDSSDEQIQHFEVKQLKFI